MAQSQHAPEARRSPEVRDAADPPRPALSISAPQLAFLIVKARAFDAEVPPVGTEDGSDMPDDRAVAALEDTPDNPTEEELSAALRDLNIDQLTEVIALVLVGRGDFTAEEWPQALAQAREMADRRRVNYLIETPLLGDLIEDGLDTLGYNVTDEEMNRS
jgi:hypothetical protein